MFTWALVKKQNIKAYMQNIGKLFSGAKEYMLTMNVDPINGESLTSELKQCR